MEIHISRYPVFMKLGYFPHERLHGQEILVTLALNIGQTYLRWDEDDLKSSVDYGSVITVLDAHMRGRELKLIETAVVSLGRILLEKFTKIETLKVTLEKPIIPDGLAKGASIKVSHHFNRADEQSMISLFGSHSSVDA